MKTAALIPFALFWFALPVFPQNGGKVLLKTGFENADLNGWRTAGDVCVAPAFCAGEPSGRYWVAFSTNSSTKDSFTMCGYSSVEGVQTVLRTPELPLPYKPARIKVDFDLKFLTNENITSDLGNDILQVRLLTGAGPVSIFAMDDAGPSPGSQNLTISGDPTFRASDCAIHWKHESNLLRVSYYRTFHEPVLSQMMQGPIALEFVIMNLFDQDFDSAVVLDNVRIRVFPPGRSSN